MPPKRRSAGSAVSMYTSIFTDILHKRYVFVIDKSKSARYNQAENKIKGGAEMKKLIRAWLAVVWDPEFVLALEESRRAG